MVGERMIGRDRELRILENVMFTARAGQAGVVVVSGAAGIGKTRLCREAAAWAEAAGFTVAWGGCWPDGGAPPLWPWQTILNGLPAPCSAADLLQRDPGGANIDPERFARFTAVADQLATACARAPVLIVVDDAHDADPGAMLLIRFVARTLVRQPLVLLLTTRVTDKVTAGVDSDATLVTLGPLDLAETGAFLRSHGAPITADDELRAVHRLTGGHPLHLSHVVSHDAVGAGQPGSDGVRAAIARALATLPAQSGRILRYATVLGVSPTVPEVIAVLHTSAEAVRSALADATAAGLVQVTDEERFSFSHELIREVLHEQLSPDERTAAHACAADALRDATAANPDQLVRYAHHALRAASRSRADAERAIDASRDAAQALVGSFAYERASALLAEAYTLHSGTRPASRSAPLLVDWADAVLHCGRLAEARALCEQAVLAADAEHDPVSLARAALGLGGVWVNEHRSRLDWERVCGLQRRALAGLPDGEVVLRLRLEMRLAVEGVYRGGPVEPALAVLDRARRLGDGQALAEALSLCHHILLTPEHTHQRVALADEQIAVASAAGEGMLALVGLCWRTVDAFQSGDPRGPQLLAELRERADLLRCLSVRYIVDCIEVMLLIRAGRLDEAEAKAYACLELGTQVGDADAPGYLGAHLVTIRWLQAREPEMLDTIERLADSPTLNPSEFSFRAGVASLAARIGQPDRARAMLDRLCGPSYAAGLAALPRSSTWLAGMASIAETAGLLGDTELARQAYELLLPYAELPIVPSLAVTCFGSVERVLGLAAAGYGDVDLAVTHLERAVAANRLLGNRPISVIAAAELVDVLLRRRAPGDHERATELLTTAGQDARELGMPARAAACADRLAELAEQRATIRRAGRFWTLSVGTHRAVVPDRLGVRYLSQLLTSPHRPISALALVGGPTGLARSAPQPVLDNRAVAAYRRRVTELSAWVADAESTGDESAVKRFRGELDGLLDELRRTTGKGGRSRRFADPAERARTAVRKAIKRAVDEITDADPTVGALLRDTVTTGATCCYVPAPSRPVRWTLQAAEKPRRAAERR